MFGLYAPMYQERLKRGATKFAIHPKFSTTLLSIAFFVNFLEQFALHIA
jgi:hypothetical protein